MIKDNKSQHCYLPKWPRCLIIGEPVSPANAKEIIFALDSSFRGRPSWHFGGNNRQLRDYVTDRSGFKYVPENPYNAPLENLIREKMVDEFNRLEDVEYLNIGQVSTSYIGGPSGWCDVQGNIGMDKNIGKWPNCEEVLKDLDLIAERWPFLKFTLVLFGGETSEDTGTIPVFKAEVENGVVTVVDPLSPATYPTPQSTDQFVAALIHQLNHSDHRVEVGVPLIWIDEWCDRTRKIIGDALKEV